MLLRSALVSASGHQAMPSRHALVAEDSLKQNDVSKDAQEEENEAARTPAHTLIACSRICPSIKEICAKSLACEVMHVAGTLE